MKICVLAKDKNRISAIKFICTKVFESLGFQFEFDSVKCFSELKELLSEENIIFYDDNNDVVTSGEFVDYVITTDSKAYIFAMADTRKGVYRLLPASPYAVIDIERLEEQIITNLKKVIQIIVKNV